MNNQALPPPRPARKWPQALWGLGFSLWLVFFAFFTLRATELPLDLALAPFMVGPLIWPLVFYLSADLDRRGSRLGFVALMTLHYVGLAYALVKAPAYEWSLYWDAFKLAFPQAAVYLWVQIILWRRLVRLLTANGANE